MRSLAHGPARPAQRSDDRGRGFRCMSASRDSKRIWFEAASVKVTAGTGACPAGRPAKDGRTGAGRHGWFLAERFCRCPCSAAWRGDRKIKVLLPTEGKKAHDRPGRLAVL